MKKILAIIFIMILTISCVYAEEEIEKEYVKGRVISVEEEEIESNFITKIQYITVEILSGEKKGEIVEVENALSDSIVTDIEVEVGQKVLVMNETLNGVEASYIVSHARDHYLTALVIVFIISLLVVGKLKGLKTIFTLAITVGFVFFIELPLLVKGYHAVAVTVVVALLVTVITVTVISGFTKKSLAAVLGTAAGVVVAGGIAIFVSTVTKVTGMSMEEAVMLLSIKGETLNFQYLLFAGILLGALGAIMDVAMSIASSIEEVHLANNSLSFRELFNSGMRVGRDIMGTMANTLILAYTGSALPLLLLFFSIEDDFIRLINLDIITTEVIRSVAGSIGLVFTIPITALISVALIKNKRLS